MEAMHVKVVAARFYAAAAAVLSGCDAAFTTDSRSGLSVTVVAGVQLRYDTRTYLKIDFYRVTMT